MYLVELFSWVSGHSTCQRLVPLEEMSDWRFYNSAEWMCDSYEGTVQVGWERESEKREAEAAAACSNGDGVPA